MIEHFKVEVIVIIYFFHSFKYFIKGLVLVYIDECFRIKCLFAQSISPIDGNSLRCEGLYYFFGTITIIAKILKYTIENLCSLSKANLSSTRPPMLFKYLPPESTLL